MAAACGNLASRGNSTGRSILSNLSNMTPLRSVGYRDIPVDDPAFVQATTMPRIGGVLCDGQHISDAHGQVDAMEPMPGIL